MLIKTNGWKSNGTQTVTPLKCKRCGKRLHKNSHEICGRCLKIEGCGNKGPK